MRGIGFQTVRTYIAIGNSEARGAMLARTIFGGRIRLAIAGADIDNYGQVPHGSPPVFTIGRADSFLDLPCAPTKAAVDRGDIR